MNCPWILRLAALVAGLVLTGSGLSACSTGQGATGGESATPSTTSVAGSAGVGSAGAGSATANGPQQRTFTPFTSSGTPAVTVAGQASGSCWTSSIAVAQPNAYRCLVGNDIDDPCFAPATAAPTTVLCVSAPWSPATLLTLTGPLPSSSPAVLTGNPWALQLADGVRCVDATGTVPTVAGIALNYVCDGGRDAGLVKPVPGPAGGLAPSQVRLSAGGSGTRLSTVSITTIWNG